MRKTYDKACVEKKILYFIGDQRGFIAYIQVNSPLSKNKQEVRKYEKVFGSVISTSADFRSIMR